jgi:N-acetylglucosaminyldiphosphoundecaprenol N-acetyl-beta-D-mannosaminyltransferase
MTNRQTIEFLGIQVDVLDTQGLCEQIVDFSLKGKQCKVFYVNADCILLSLKDKIYRQMLNRADLLYADGIGVVWGAKLWGHYLPSRSTAADFIPKFCEVFARYGLKIYFLGASDGVAKEAANRLLQKIPNLQIVGTHHGYFKGEETKRIIEAINTVRPHILLVGLGAPYQEQWIEENANGLDVPVIWGVGGLFDFISGRTWRGPQWLLDHGFEWFCRLIAEPRRLWRRYLIGNTKFVIYLLWYRFISHKTW